MAEKKKTTRPKKSPAKKKSASPRRQKTAASTSTPAPPPSSNKAPLYLLIILVCAAVIAILVNQLYFRERSETRGTNVSERVITQKSHESQSASASRDEKNANAIKTPKEGKIEDKDKKEEKKIIESKVKVFFLRVDDRTEHVTLVPVTRNIKGEASLEKALGELIKGPNQTERGRGLLSAVPSNIKVRGISVKNGIAEIDFNDAVERNAAGSILISRLDQIVYTATEMDGIRGVIIKINGKRKQIFGSDGLSIGGPLHRRQ